ncbi:hypothetical protein MY4824_006733 [Beauveria thailandica]
MSVGSPHADSGSIAYCGQDMWLENGTLEDSIIDNGKTAVTILAYLPGDDGILRKSKTAVLLATYLKTIIGAPSRDGARFCAKRQLSRQRA